MAQQQQVVNYARTHTMSIRTCPVQKPACTGWGSENRNMDQQSHQQQRRTAAKPKKTEARRSEATDAAFVVSSNRPAYQERETLQRGCRHRPLFYRRCLATLVWSLPEQVRDAGHTIDFTWGWTPTTTSPPPLSRHWVCDLFSPQICTGSSWNNPCGGERLATNDDCSSFPAVCFRFGIGVGVTA